MIQQQRLQEPKKHLDASVVPVKNAFLHRAATLESQAATARNSHILTMAQILVLEEMAAEHRRMAEELHHW